MQMSNSNKNERDVVGNNEPFDHHDFDNNHAQDHQEQDRSELANQKKVTARGQKLMTLMLMLLAGIIIVWMIYKYTISHPIHAPAKLAQKNTDPTFTLPPQRSFGDDFAQTNGTTAAGASAPVVTNAPVTTPAPIGLVQPPNATQQSIVNGVNPSSPRTSPQIRPYTGSTVQQPQIQAQAVETPLQRMLKSNFAGGSSGSGEGSGGAAPSPASYNGGGVTGSQSASVKDPLNDVLQATPLKMERAQRMMHRDYVISAGSMIDCALETKFNSTVVGMLTCDVTRNIYSASGRVILIDRGSKIIGQYKGGLMQGQARTFVLWTRVETPNGVVMTLDSPASSPLGENGMNGYVDNHFWDRFGGAILVSMIDGLGQALSTASSDYLTAKINSALNIANNGSNGFQGSAQATSVPEKIIEQSVNIPPTMIKHQGDRVNVFVARDLDFSNVYRVAGIANQATTSDTDNQ
jgi:type IV secretion system protein VirB10